jgi:hypothetical protein
VTARVWRRKRREVKRRPVHGNSPNDRIQHGPDCNRPKRACANSFPATPSPQAPTTRTAIGVRFLGMTESFAPMWSFNLLNPGRYAAFRSALGPGIDRRDERSAPCSSFAMSSGRLILDRVARQHCPSPLHRRAQTNMRLIPNPWKPDISTLQRIGHFYFALTCRQTSRSVSTQRVRK